MINCISVSMNNIVSFTLKQIFTSLIELKIIWIEIDIFKIYLPNNLGVMCEF